MTLSRSITVAVTEAHGVMQEAALHPPVGVRYVFPEATGPRPWYLSSPIKGYLRRFDADEWDLVEAVIGPVLTNRPWIYSIACFQEALAFELRGAPLPRAWRRAWMVGRMRRDNFKALVFWSEAGRGTLRGYGGVDDPLVEAKTRVVYPAVARIDDARLYRPDRPARNLLFSGDFFRKGGVNVLDTFLRLQVRYPELRLRLCCDESIDFNTADTALRARCLQAIRTNPAIEFGRVDRATMLDTVLPQTDIYLLPTYSEAFGYSVLEAMAYGIPVIASNVFAIPEMITDGNNGLLLDLSMFDLDAMFPGYVIDRIPDALRQHVDTALEAALCHLLDDVTLRERLSRRAVETARSRFSVETRNSAMSRIYDDGLSG
jgi:glycosyltransferase involved in cell wall biosynthesis